MGKKSSTLIITAQYIWIDGRKPTAKLRSKTKIIPLVHKLSDIPPWGFDGSSTEQATTDKSDCALMPVRYLPDPILGGKNIIVLCEVMNADGTPHSTNTRARLREATKRYGKFDCWFGMEQEYTMYDTKGKWPFGWPAEGYPAPQGKHYCGVGCDEVYGRHLVEAHTFACLEAGILISGTNAEVMPGQWEFQIGPLGPLEIADQMWISRFLLYRLGEDYGISVKLDPKPIEEGDWNGTGCHINFSTKQMRAKGGIKHIEVACKQLGKFHHQHMKVYGVDNDKRLTGKHETAPFDRFSYGVSNRGASIRIPMDVNKNKCGYLEDRRSAANIDPYQGCVALMETVCGDGFKP